MICTLIIRQLDRNWASFLYIIFKNSVYLSRNDVVSNLNKLNMYRNALQESKSIEDLIDETCEYMRSNLSYAFTTIHAYRKLWRGLSRFMEQNSYIEYDKSVGEQFLIFRLVGKSPEQYKRYEKTLFRSIKFIDEFHQRREITIEPKAEDFSGNIGIAIESYLSYRERENRLSPRTLHGDRLYMSKFIRYLNMTGITEIEKINLQTVIRFLQSLNTTRRACRSSCITKLRCMFRYWHEHHLVAINLASQMPNDIYRKQEKLPSVYTVSEINSMLDNIDRSNGQGKRDYAILMLLSRYGLRASDICQLKFENIRWEENKIIINQYKTGNRLELPLLQEAGEAIIDYLKYGRQVSILPNIFLLLTSPYGQICSGTIYDAVNKAMRSAGVKPGKRRHGSHIFRHSLASLLLEEQIILPVISDVLGHTSCGSTRTYTRIDMNSLKKCILEVPPVESVFYMQKGGFFYE